MGGDTLAHRTHLTGDQGAASLAAAELIAGDGINPPNLTHANRSGVPAELPLGLLRDLPGCLFQSSDNLPQ
jgi:hypothetical protein